MHVALFKLAPARTRNGVSCDASGAFIGTIPLLERAKADMGEKWTPRNIKTISRDLSRCLGLPINTSQKAAGIAAIAKALNAGDVARAQMLTLFLRFPDPASVTKANPSRADIFKFVDDLISGGFIKFNSNHWPAGVPDDQGGEFAPKGDGDNANTAQARQLEPSDVDSFGHQVTADERARLNQLGSSAALTVAQAPSATSDGHTSAANASYEANAHAVPLVVTAADMAVFGPRHREEAKKLAAQLGHGATPEEFLALSSVESIWGKSPAALQAGNFFGIHNREGGPFPGQTGTYVTSGQSPKNKNEVIPGHLEDQWLSPNNQSNPVQNMAAFAPETGYMDSGSVVATRLLTPKVLADSGGDYSNPAVFFAIAHSNGWGAGIKNDYVRTMLRRIRHFRP